MMAQRAAEMNVSFPAKGENVILNDINLMNPSEYFDIKVEVDYYQTNPDQCQYLNWLMAGAVEDPNWLDEASRR